MNLNPTLYHIAQPGPKDSTFPICTALNTGGENARVLGRFFATREEAEKGLRTEGFWEDENTTYSVETIDLDQVVGLLLYLKGTTSPVDALSFDDEPVYFTRRGYRMALNFMEGGNTEGEIARMRAIRPKTDRHAWLAGLSVLGQLFGIPSRSMWKKVGHLQKEVIEGLRKRHIEDAFQFSLAGHFGIGKTSP